MKQVPKSKEILYHRVAINNQMFNIDSRIWGLFETRAADRKQSLLTLAGEYVKEGKSVERALADALEVFGLVG